MPTNKSAPNLGLVGPDLGLMGAIEQLTTEVAALRAALLAYQPNQEPSEQPFPEDQSADQLALKRTRLVERLSSMHERRSTLEMLARTYERASFAPLAQLVRDQLIAPLDRAMERISKNLADLTLMQLGMTITLPDGRLYPEPGSVESS